MPRSSPRWRLDTRKKRRILYLLPSYESRLLALPFQSRTATRSPTLVYVINASGYFPHGILCQMQDNHISAGICRCTILDFGMKSARISIRQEPSRINAFSYENNLCRFGFNGYFYYVFIYTLRQWHKKREHSLLGKCAAGMFGILCLYCWVNVEFSYTCS